MNTRATNIIIVLLSAMLVVFIATDDTKIPEANTEIDVFQVIQRTETDTVNITLEHKNKGHIVIFSLLKDKCPNIEAITIGSWWALETYMRGEVRLISAYSMCEIQNE